MAADKITIDLDLNARKAQREVAALQKKIDALGKSMSKGLGGIGGAGSTDKVRALGTGLSKATVRADEFSKSLEASNARVIAFGASAGLIMQVDRALRAMVTSAIKVEKAMMDVNIVMNANAKTLDKFGKGMFKVAKETAQGFDTVAEAATELARQGLGMEKTLTRTKDALILTRLTGMNAADAVKSLTAAVNSFNKEGVTSAQVVNRMAKVDAAFAVSSEDLAKSISRVGASAQSAGVSMNELMAITTAVQQRTARGGAVIGNAFKTIFTRIQRSDVQQKLENLGVATRSMSGEMLSGIQVLQNLAKNFDSLSKAQQSSTAESVAGVFQVNILRSALGDLAQKNSAYAGALRAANSATDEAYQKNEKLNQTLDALVNRTLANLTKAGASLGGDLFGPAINNALGAVNGLIEAFGEGGKLEKFGEGFGKDMLQGLGKFIGGPGLILVTAAFGKLALNLGKFATTAMKDFMGLNAAVKQRAALEDMVIKKLQAEPALISQIASGERTVSSVQKEILAIMQKQTAERAQQVVLAKQLSAGMYSAGARVTPRGFGAFGGGRRGKADGYVPNFANAGAERAAAAAGGYKAGAIRTMSQPGGGTMMYNSAETVKQFPGMTQKAIMPPANSAAGAGYKTAFGAAHGFDPYAAGGFVPNFVRTRSTAGTSKRTKQKSDKKINPALINKVYQIDASDIGVILGLADGKVKPKETFLSDVKSLAGLRNNSPALYKDLAKEGAKVRLNNVRVESFINTPKEGHAENMFEALLSKELTSGTGNIAKKIMTRFGIEGNPGKMGPLPAGLQGEVFEEAMRMAMKAAVAIPGADFDFEAGKPPSPALAKIFGQPILRIDAKRRLKSAQGGEMPKKYFNDRQTRTHGVSLINRERRRLIAGKALGYVPNFSPLTSAIDREMQAGVPASAIRVSSSPALRSAGNPSGVGVYNTIHEPAGLNQGINRSRSAGVDPRTHGVPNFAVGAAVGIGSKILGYGKTALGYGKTVAQEGIGIGGTMMGASMYGSEAGGLGGALMRIGGSGLMGSMGGLPGVLGGLGLGVLTEAISFLGASSDDAADALKQQVEAQNEAAAAAKESALAFGEAAERMSVAEFVVRKQGELRRIAKVHPEMVNTPEYRALGSATKENFGALSKNFYDQVEKVKRFSSAVENFKAPDFKNLDRTKERKNRQFSAIPLIDFEANTRPTFRKGNVEEAEGQAKKLLELLAAQGITPKARMDELVKSGMTLDQFERGRGLGGIAGAIGISKDRFTELSSKLTGPFGPEGIENIEGIVTDTFSNVDLFKESLKEAAEDQKKANETIKEYTNTNLDNIRSLSMLKNHFMDLGSAAKLAHGLEMQRIRQAKATLDLDNRLEMAQKASGRTIYGVLAAQKEQALNPTTGTIFRNKKLAEEAAAATRKRDVVGASLGAQMSAVDKVLKMFKDGQLAEGGALGRTEAAKAVREKVRFYETQFNKTNAEGADYLLQSMVERRATLAATQSVEGALPFDAATELSTLEALLPKYIESRNAEYREREIAAQKAKDDAILAEKTHELKIQEYNNQFELATKQRQLDRIKKAGLARQLLEEAEGLASNRQIGARGRNAAFSATLAADVRARGVQKGDMGRAFRAGFINEFGYEPVDQLEDFEKGSRQVAQTMKSSFADAFRSIASGASTAGEAIAMMAQSILDSISQVSTNMFTNMMFARMSGQAQGGYIPGYNSGGLITGGSGYKDDVPIRATGGEFVIKKSAVNKIGVPTLNSINGMANGGMSMGKVGMIAAGASAASGLLGAAMQPGAPDPAPSQNYGFGRSKHGYLGGADPDARGPDMISGGSGRASASLNKAYVYYRRDPQTGQLISERARPTEGRFEVSDRLSLLGRLGEDDPQTARMFQKEEAMSNYQGYLAQETSRRRAAVKAVQRKKRGNLIQAYANAAMLIGGAHMMDKMAAKNGGGPGNVGIGDGASSVPEDLSSLPPVAHKPFTYDSFNLPKANGGMIATMGGEYVMSPEAVRTHGINFMTELNRGNVPGYASGGLVGAPPAAGGGGMVGGSTTNNVSINVNIDKNGKASADGSATSQQGGPSERDERQEFEDNKELGEVLQGVVLQEIVRQQRPGGLLNKNTTGVS